MPKIEHIFKDIDIAGSFKDSFDIFFDSKDINKLKINDISFSYIKYTVNKVDFLTLQETYDYMDSLHACYPNITAIETLNFTHQYNLPLKILKINGDNPNTYNNQNAFLLMSMHHAREWQTVNQTIFFADSLLSSYGVDSVLTNIINNNFIVIFPIVNPDGYCYSRDSSNLSWRKNRTLRNAVYGVDLNRNYGGGINGDPSSDWGFIFNSATSHDPSSEVYCGPYSNSEIEVKTVQNLIKNYNFNVSISLHSYGEDIMWPWASVSYGAPDSALLEGIGKQMASLARKQDGTSQYTAIQSADFYPTTGDSDDWIYGWTKYVKGKTTLPYTFEIDNNFNSSTSEEIDSLIRRVYPAILHGLIMCDSVQSRINEIPLKPSLTHTNDTLLWTLTNNEYADFYKIYRYSSPVIIMDSTNNTLFLDKTGFSETSIRAFSGSSSYISENTANASDIIQNTYKYKVNANDSLIFYTYYDLENVYDKGFVEISENGYEYFIIDTINGVFGGNNSDWQRIAISLNQYVDKEIYYRIRVVFDGGTFGEGLYIDNIYPVMYFNSDSIICDSLNDTFIEINADTFDYYYAIMPHLNWKDLYVNLSDRLLINGSLSIPNRVLNGDKYIFYEWSTKILHIKNKDIKNNVTIHVYNILGRKVLSHNCYIFNGTDIDMSSLKAGRYFITIDNNMDYDKYGFLIIK